MPGKDLATIDRSIVKKVDGKETKFAFGSGANQRMYILPGTYALSYWTGRSVKGPYTTRRDIGVGYDSKGKIGPKVRYTKQVGWHRRKTMSSCEIELKAGDRYNEEQTRTLINSNCDDKVWDE